MAKRMMKELTAYVSDYLGNDSTTFETELRDCGRELLGDIFGGVFAKGEVYPKNKYVILNTETRDNGGRHWFAVAPDQYVYDSLKPNGFYDDVEQDQRTKDCGSRALAWMVLHYADPVVAKLV